MPFSNLIFFKEDPINGAETIPPYTFVSKFAYSKDFGISISTKEVQS